MAEHREDIGAKIRVHGEEISGIMFHGTINKEEVPGGKIEEEVGVLVNKTHGGTINGINTDSFRDSSSTTLTAFLINTVSTDRKPSSSTAGRRMDRISILLVSGIGKIKPASTVRPASQIIMLISTAGTHRLGNLVV